MTELPQQCDGERRGICSGGPAHHPECEAGLPARMSEIRELAARAVQQAQDMRRLAQRTWRAAVHSERLNAEIAAKLRADPELREAIEMAEAEPVGHLTPEEI